MKRFLEIVRKPEIIPLIFILAIVTYRISESASNQEVRLIRNLEVWQPEKSMDYDESWFEEPCKVVVYMKNYKKFHRLDLWKKYIDKYPNIPFLFYYSGSDHEKYLKQLEEIEFNHPIIIDREDQFYEENSGILEDDYSFIAYVINNNTTEMSNPTISNFEKLLKECSKSIDK